MQIREDTIVAVSSAPGRGAIALVRMSGAAARTIAARISTGLSTAPRAVRLATIRDLSGRVLDRGVVTWYAGPASYTGEDVVEFAVHGGQIVPPLVMAACVEAGARPADPGEFTERAVWNGKLDLVQAEAVADVIDARSRAAHRMAMHQLDGGLSRRLSELRNGLLGIDALIAYEIDFPEEDDGPLPRERTLAACDAAVLQLTQLLATAPMARLGRDGALVVLAGAPNAGKSSLFNALVGESRVLVSEIPGTTRDAVEALVDATPVPWRLVDTAGLREGGDTLERMGIEVSERYLAGAHVVVACADATEALEPLVEALRSRTVGAIVPVLTKADRQGVGDAVPSGRIAVSSVSGAGISDLIHAINTTLTSLNNDINEDSSFITSARQEQSVQRALDELHLFREAWTEQALPAPVAATHLRAATTALEHLIGAVDVEEVLGAVFQRFCVGK